VNALQSFLAARRPKFGTLQNLAEQMGVTFSGFLRGVKQGTLSAENCLRLAEVLGEDPRVVFRAAQKAELAEQIDRLYGAAVPHISAAQRAVLDMWEALAPEDQRTVRELLHRLAPHRRATAADQKKGR
jgi:hypothetical protein